MILTRQITAEETIPLRHEVLRPGMPRESARFSGDTDPGTSHWGAFGPDGSLMAVATLLRSPKPGSSEPAWQIRGMASSPVVRGQGYGAAVLHAILDHVARQQPGGVVWCNARVSALRFYLSRGFEIEGDEFEIAGVGPHYVMSRRA